MSQIQGNIKEKPLSLQGNFDENKGIFGKSNQKKVEALLVNVEYGSSPLHKLTLNPALVLAEKYMYSKSTMLL